MPVEKLARHSPQNNTFDGAHKYKYSLRHRGALDVEEQLRLGAERANEFNLDGVNVDTELDNKSLNSCHIRRLTFMPGRIHGHLQTTYYKLLLVSKNK